MAAAMHTGPELKTKTNCQIRQKFLLRVGGQGRLKGGTLGASAPQCLAEQLTLYQPGGQIMPTTVLQAPQNFLTLRRP